jgi:PAS domain S-box-containing protein
LGDRTTPARLAALIPLVIGCVAIAGWLSGFKILTSLVPGAVAMKINTAVCLTICGGALFIVSGRTTVNREAIARAAAVIAAVIGLAVLGEYVFGWQLGIDELLLKDTMRAYNVFPGRMSPYTAIAITVFGLGIATLRLPYLDKMARLFAAFGLAIGILSLIGYFWNVAELITDSWLPPVAVNTAVCFIALGIGMLWSRDYIEAEPRQAVLLAGVEIRVLVGFAIALTLLIVGGSFTYRDSAEYAKSVEWVAHTQEVRAVLADVYGSLAGAEVSQREYFLTRENAPLNESRKLIERANDDVSRLAQLLTDNPIQLTNLTKLRQLVEHRTATLTTGLTAFHDYGIPAVRAVLTLSRANGTVEDIRVQRDLMDDIEERLLSARRDQTERVRATTLISLLITLGVAIGLFVFLFRSIHQEIAARRIAERALIDSDNYNRSIIEGSPDCMAVLTSGAHITQMTPHAMRLMDIKDFASVSGMDWCELWSAQCQSQARAAVAMARTGTSGRFDGQTRSKTGTEKWWDVIVMPIATNRGQPERLLAVARDLTEVKLAERKLLEANRFLDSLIESLPVMVAVKDAKDLRFVRHNRMFEEMLGLTSEQIDGKTVEDFLQPEEAELTNRTDRAALETGKLLEIPERTVATPAGAKTLTTQKVPIFDSQGAAQYLLAISTDISERKLSELAIRELNAELQGKAKALESSNKELESFSYSVSHDLRAPLRAIDGFAEIIEQDYDDRLDDEGRRYLSVIRQNSKRMGELIDDLLAFSRLGRQTVAKTDINMDVLVREVVDEVVNLNAMSAAEGAPKPQVEIGPLPAVQGDRQLLRQVWINLISNAVKYSSKQAAPRIEVSGGQVGSENQYSVRDNGVGFSMEYVNKLFGVFQRLHRADEFTGTGVGLAIVHRIIARHGGRVWAEGKINEGAVFSIALPIGVRGG